MPGRVDLRGLGPDQQHGDQPMLMHQVGKIVEVVVQIGQPLPHLDREYEMLSSNVGQQHGIVSAVTVQQWQSDWPIAPELSPPPPHDSWAAR